MTEEQANHIVDAHDMEGINGVWELYPDASPEELRNAYDEAWAIFGA